MKCTPECKCALRLIDDGEPAFCLADHPSPLVRFGQPCAVPDQRLVAMMGEYEALGRRAARCEAELKRREAVRDTCSHICPGCGEYDEGERMRRVGK